MKRTICLILSLTSILIGFGQSLSLKGRIVDRGNNPVADAYVMVFSRDTSLLASCFTDFAGEFSLVADSSLSKTIRVSCLGYETVWQSLPLTGSIVMAGDSRILSGLT